MSADGADVGAIDALKDGLVARGVLLGMPRARGVAWIERKSTCSRGRRPSTGAGGERSSHRPLASARARQNDSTHVRSSNPLGFVRTGHARRLTELEPWDTGTATAACTHGRSCPQPSWWMNHRAAGQIIRYA